MTELEALRILEAYSHWRRADDEAITFEWLRKQGATPKAIGLALEFAILALAERAKKDDKATRLARYRKEAAEWRKRRGIEAC